MSTPEPIEAEQSDARPVDVNTVLTAIKNARRREVIKRVADHDCALRKDELADAIAFIESDAEHPDLINHKERQTVLIALHQLHLPRLMQWGLIEFDGRKNLVSATPATEPVAKIARTVDQEVARMNGGGLA